MRRADSYRLIDFPTDGTNRVYDETVNSPRPTGLLIKGHSGGATPVDSQVVVEDGHGRQCIIPLYAAQTQLPLIYPIEFSKIIGDGNGGVDTGTTPTGTSLDPDLLEMIH